MASTQEWSAAKREATVKRSSRLAESMPTTSRFSHHSLFANSIWAVMTLLVPAVDHNVVRLHTD